MHRPRGVAVIMGLVVMASVAARADSADSRAGSIEGIVQGPDGRRLGGALVAAVWDAMADGAAAAASARSRADGSFRLTGLAMGAYALTATAPRLAAVFRSPSPVGPGKDLRGIVLRLGQTGYTVSGVLRALHDGKPVAQAQVRAKRLDGHDTADTFYVDADVNGAYAITLPVGSYGLFPAAPGHEGEMVRVQTLADRSIDLQLGRSFPPGPAPREVLDWMQTHATRLAAVEAGHGFSDLQPLRKIVGDAEVVAMGEATHGTREFFQLKHRVFEFLVEKLGFTTIAIEAEMSDCFDVNEYVLTGRGDPVHALFGVFNWPWWTEEMLELVRWMRRYNVDPRHTKKVKFYGFDMQSWGRPINHTRAYLRRVAPAQAARLEQTVAPLLAPFAPPIDELPRAQADAGLALLGEIIAMLDKRRAELAHKSGAAAWALARQHARLAQMAIAYRLAGPILRGPGMSENIRWILQHEGPGTRMLAWAHNGHVSYGGSMGNQLRETLGKRVVTFGLLFNQGTFAAMKIGSGGVGGPQPFTVGDAPLGSLDQTLAAAGLQVAALHLRDAPTRGVVGAWWNAQHKSHNIGGGYKEDAEHFQSARVGALYDAVLFVEKTTALRPLPDAPTRKAPQLLAGPANLDFEQGTVGKIPTDWSVSDFLVTADWRIETSEQGARQGKRCAVIKRTSRRIYGAEDGQMSQTIDAAVWRGKRVTLRAAVRAKLAGSGNDAYLWLRMKMGKRPQTPVLRKLGGPQWRDYEIAVQVPEDAQSLSYGLIVQGVGEVAIDAISLTIRPIP